MTLLPLTPLTVQHPSCIVDGMSELTAHETDLLRRAIAETIHHPKCDACGWTIWPDRPSATATGHVDDHDAAGHVDDLHICERCVDVGTGVWVSHEGAPWLRTAFDTITVIDPKDPS